MTPAGSPVSEAASAGSRGRAFLVVVPAAFALLAEGAWVAALNGLLQAMVLREPTVGIVAFALIASAGALAARWLSAARRVGARWPAATGAIAVAIGALGWLASPDVRATLAAQGLGGVGPALLAHPGGWLAAIAFVRGTGYARLPVDPWAIATLLGIGVPALALMALVGGMIADPARSRFLSAALDDVLVFLVAGILALVFSRLVLVGSGAGIDWRRNPAWVALLLLLLVGVAGAALGASALGASPAAGAGIGLVLGSLVPPLFLLGLVIGFDRRSVRIIAASIGIGLLIGTGIQLLGRRSDTLEAVAPAVPLPDPTTASDAGAPLAVILLGGLLVVATVGALVLALILSRRPRDAELDDGEERWIDRGDVAERAPARSRSRFRRRRAPADAVAAYRALLEDLDGRPWVGREADETPAEHAGRLRGNGLGALGLDLLAADYGLVRFGAGTLTPAEERRAIGRAATLRRTLLEAAARLGPVEAPVAGAAEREEKESPDEGPGARSRFRVG